MAGSRHAGGFVPFGGRLCLDFANTVNGRLTDAPEELITDPAALSAWGCRVGLLSERAADAFAAASRANPVAAAACLADAVALRETICRVFDPIATGKQPPRAEVERLTDAYRGAIAHARVVPGKGGAPWRWEAPPSDDPLTLGWLFWPITRSAIDLLTSPDLASVKRCAGADRGCGGLFVDETKNGIRRWCRMDDCGSRAKMRRLYARRRATRIADQ